jgi:hypothetical protein
MRKLLLLLLCIFFGVAGVAAQKRPATSAARPAKAAKSPEIGQTAVVIDETLSVLRMAPSLYAEPVHRMQRGRKVQIKDIIEADGVKFFKVLAPPSSLGWVQADAVFGKFRPGDEERCARLIQAMDGFEQIEAAVQFFELYPDSKFRPAILLLFGDLLEETALRLTRDATNRLKRTEMAASAAPLHSYYLNFVMLDRYRKMGITFVFNPSTKQYHYDGSSWKQIVAKWTMAPEAVEAKKRLDTLKQKMEATTAAAAK